MPRTLLLADDSVTMQKVVGIVFAHEDIQVTAVANGEDAIARARELLPDIVLADVVMPGKDGYQVCEELKRDPATRHIPVLLLAGTFEPFDEARAKSVGCDGHMPKPFESARLVERVKALVEGRTAAGAAPANVVAPQRAAVPPAARPPVAMPPGLSPAGARPPMPPPSIRPGIAQGPSLTPGPFAAPPFAPPQAPVAAGTPAPRPPVPGAFPPPPPPSIARPPMGAPLRPPAAPPRPPPSVIVPPGAAAAPFARPPAPSLPSEAPARPAAPQWAADPFAPVEPIRPAPSSTDDFLFGAPVPATPAAEARPAPAPSMSAFAAPAEVEFDEEEEITLDEEVPVDLDEPTELLGSPVTAEAEVAVELAPAAAMAPIALEDEGSAFDTAGGFFADEEFSVPVATPAPERTPVDPWEASEASPVAAFTGPALEISSDVIPGAEVIELSADEPFAAIALTPEPSLESSEADEDETFAEVALAAEPPVETVDEFFAAGVSFDDEEAVAVAADPDATPGPDDSFEPSAESAEAPAAFGSTEVGQAAAPAPAVESPAVAPAPAPGDGGEAALRAAIAAASREVIEKIAWEVVPQLAEVILREHVERLVRAREGRE